MALLLVRPGVWPAAAPVGMNGSNAMQTTGTEIYTSPHLVGFWLFSHAGKVYAGLLEHDPAAQRSRLVIDALDPGQAHLIRRTETEGTWVSALDARVLGQELALVLEINSSHALQLVRTPLNELIEPQQRPLTISASRYLDLTSSQQSSVQVPPAESWNVAGPLAPRRWLFSPHLERGADRTAVVANTADGKAVGIEVDGGAGQPGAVSVANAALPQALKVGNDHYLAFQRFSSPYRPFWSLSRYSGPREVVPGRLWIVRDSAAPMDLSASCGLGGITAFALASDGQQTPWIFVLHGSGSISGLTAVAYRNGAWAVADRSPLPPGADQVAALQANGMWYLLVSSRAGSGWSLRYLNRP